MAAHDNVVSCRAGRSEALEPLRQHAPAAPPGARRASAARTAAPAPTAAPLQRGAAALRWTACPSGVAAAAAATPCTPATTSRAVFGAGAGGGGACTGCRIHTFEPPSRAMLALGGNAAMLSARAAFGATRALTAQPVRLLAGQSGQWLLGFARPRRCNAPGRRRAAAMHLGQRRAVHAAAAAHVSRGR